MLVMLAVLLPPYVVLMIRRFLGERESSVLATYLGSALAVNFFSVCVTCFAFGNQTGIEGLLAQNAVFWVKYTLLAVFLSCLVAVASTWAGRHVTFRFELSDSLSWSWARKACVVFTAILFLMHFVRIFNFDFWGDEAFSVLLARMSVPEMLAVTAGDVHPPFYYLTLMAANRLFGDAGWAYNLVSLVPYGLTMLLALTVVWKSFGGSAAIILIACQSLMTSAVTYNVEVRMYSWAAFFVLVAYVWLLRVMNHGTVADWVIFCVASLAAAYTHYYALIMAAFLYLGLIVFHVVRRLPLRRIIVACAATLAGYSPWLLVLVQTLERTAGNFWMTTVPSLSESLLFPFNVGGAQIARFLLCLFILGVVCAVLKGAGVVRTSKEDGRWELTVSSRLTLIGDQTFWILTGVICFLGTIVVGLAVSELIHPVFALRYLYPACSMVWLLLGVLVAQFGIRKLLSALLVALVLWVGIPNYEKVRAEEMSIQESQADTMEKMEGVEPGGCFLTDVAHLEWSVLQCDYPGVDTELVSVDNLPTLDVSRSYWLVLSTDLSGGYDVWLSDEGFEAIEVVSGGWIGRSYVNVYRLEAVDGGDVR